MRPNPGLRFFALSCLLGLAITSCNSGSGGAAPSVRPINAAIGGTSSFDVLVNGQPAASGLAYGQAGPYVTAGAGSVNVKFETAGTTSVVDTASFAATGGGLFSVLAVQGSAGLATLAVAQSNVAVNSGQTRLEFVHAAPSVGALDIYVTTAGAALPSSPSLSSLAYAGDNATLTPAALIFTSGDTRIRATAAGDSTRTIVFDSGPLTFPAGADELLTIVPVNGSASAFSVLAVAADSSSYSIGDQRVLLRVGNFSPTVSSADVFLDANANVNSSATLFASGVAFDGATAYSAVAPGAYRISFANSGQTAEFAGMTQALAAGTAISEFAIGLAGQTAPHGLQLLDLRDEPQAPAAGMANLRVLALSPDLAAVDLVLLNTAGATPVISRRLAVNLAYTGASAYVPIAAGTVTLALVPTGLDVPLLPAAGITLALAAGTAQTLVAAGCRYPATGICLASTQGLQLISLPDQ